MFSSRKELELEIVCANISSSRISHSYILMKGYNFFRVAENSLFKCLFINYKMKNQNNFHLKMKIKFCSLLFLYELYLFCLEPHCIKSAPIRSYSGPHFPTFGLNAERYFASLCIQSKCRKIWTRITSKTDTFHSVICHYCTTQEQKGNLKTYKKKEDTYITKGFSPWRKAPKCFQSHQDWACFRPDSAYKLLF